MYIAKVKAFLRGFLRHGTANGRRRCFHTRTHVTDDRNIEFYYFEM